MGKRVSACLILLAGILWGSMGIFVREYTEVGLSSIDIVAIRAVVTTALMCIFMLIRERRMFRIHWKDIWCFLGTGLLSILFFNLCYFKAITMTSMSVAAVLLYTAPAIVMILSRILFREKITVVKLGSLILTIVGCVFVTGVISGEAVMTPMGILVGLGAGLGYALYSIFSRYALERGYHIYTIIFYTFLITSIGILPFCSGSRMIAICSEKVDFIWFSLVFGLISTVLPYLLYTVGLKKIENGKASIIASVEPVVATMFGVFLFHEKLTVNGAVGMLLVLSGIILCNTGINVKKQLKKRNKK